MYKTVYTMAGRGSFPVDMLRRDRCFPATERDSMTIAAADSVASFSRDLANLPKVTLCAYHEYPDWEPNFSRWASFDWGLVSLQAPELLDD
jgi:hypothetical protein